MLDTKFEISIANIHVGKYSTNARIRINVFLLTSRFTGNLGKKSICRLVSIKHKTITWHTEWGKFWLTKHNIRSIILWIQGSVSFILRDSHICIWGNRSGSSTRKPDANTTRYARLEWSPEHKHDYSDMSLYCRWFLWISKIRRGCTRINNA